MRNHEKTQFVSENHVVVEYMLLIVFAIYVVCAPTFEQRNARARYFKEFGGVCCANNFDDVFAVLGHHKNKKIK